MDLDHYFFNDLAMDVGETEIAAGVAISQLLVIESEQMKDGRMKIMNVNRVFDHIHAQLVGRAINRAALDSATGEQHREGRVMMIAPGFGLILAILVLAIFGVRRPAKFTAPDHQREQGWKGSIQSRTPYAENREN